MSLWGWILHPAKIFQSITNGGITEANQKRRPHQLKRGDHIYAWRKKAVNIYAHHGIYVGNGKVIHFSPDSSSLSFSSSSSSRRDICMKCQELQRGLQQNTGIILSCLNCFLRGDDLYVFAYSVSDFDTYQLRGGTYTKDKSDPPDEVIHRANYLLHHGFGSYDLKTNNCETFALYCKTGLVNLDIFASDQIKSIGITFLEPAIFLLLPPGMILDMGRKIKIPVEELHGRSPAEYITGRS